MLMVVVSLFPPGEIGQESTCYIHLFTVQQRRPEPKKHRGRVGESPGNEVDLIFCNSFY